MPLLNDARESDVAVGEYEQEVSAPTFESLTLSGEEIDRQIATAKRYPRSVHKFMTMCDELVALSDSVARQCFYVLPPRRGPNPKPIEGPTVRFAEIVTYSWGHLRIHGKPVREEDRFIVCYGAAFDLEQNVARACEVRRRLTDKEGRRFSDDMVVVAGLACAAIATRNAVLSLVPKPFWEPAYLKARKVAVGDAKTLLARRATAVELFGKMAVQPDQIFALLDVRGLEDIGLDHLATLLGVFNSIKEGQTTVDEVFPPLSSIVTPPKRKSEAPRVIVAELGDSQVDSVPNGPATVSGPVKPERHWITIADVRPGPVRKGGPRVFEIVDADGVLHEMTDTGMQLLARQCCEAKRRVDIVAHVENGRSVIDELVAEPQERE